MLVCVMRDAREKRNSIKTAITYPFFNMSLLNLRCLQYGTAKLACEHESTCMHVGDHNTCELWKTIKTAINIKMCVIFLYQA